MSKIDVSQWGEFKVGDLFERVKTKKVPFKALDLPEESNSVQSLPLVAAGIDSQGRNRYIEPKYVTILQNCLTVSANGANSGAVFYQNSVFSILQDAYALQLVDMYKKYRVQNIYLFLTSVLTNVLVNNNWTNKATWRKVQDKEIYLPITFDGKPDWEYMDNYIAKLSERAHKDVSSLNQVNPKPHKINIDNWQKFKIGDVFDIQKGRRLTKADQIPGMTPFVGASADNYGITAYIGQNPIFNANTITVSYNGSVGQVFYQGEPYWASDDINVLSLKDEYDDLNSSMALFFCACIQRAGQSFGYTDKWTVNKMKGTSIFLPVAPSGQPDFDYMTKYIEMIQASAKCRLQSYHNLNRVDK